MKAVLITLLVVAVTLLTTAVEVRRLCDLTTPYTTKLSRSHLRKPLAGPETGAFHPQKSQWDGGAHTSIRSYCPEAHSTRPLWQTNRHCARF